MNNLPCNVGHHCYVHGAMHHWCIHLMRMHIFITKWTPRNRLSGLVMVTMYYTDWWKYLYTCSCTYISDEHLESEQSCFAIWNLDDFTAICIFPTTSIAPPTTADYDLKILSDLDSVNVFQNNDKQSQSAVLYKSVMLQKDSSHFSILYQHRLMLHYCK